MANQFYEWITLSHNPATDPTHTAYGSLFYIMTGLHGLHVFLGLVAMIFLLGRLKGPKGDPGETAGLPGGQLLLALRRRRLGRALLLPVPPQVDGDSGLLRCVTAGTPAPRLVCGAGRPRRPAGRPPRGRAQADSRLGHRGPARHHHQPARHQPATTAPPTPIGAATAERCRGRVKRRHRPSQTGIYYIDPAQLLHRTPARRCSPPTARAATARGPREPSRAPNLQGLGAGTVDFWVSTGRMPLANSSVQATRKPPRFNRLQTLEIAACVQSLTPGRASGIPIVNTERRRPRGGQHPVHPQLRGLPHHHRRRRRPGSTAPTPRACTWPPPPRSSRPSAPGRATCPASARATSPTPRRVDIAAYVTGVIQHPDNRGGVGLGGIGPVGEGFVGLLIGVGILMLVCFWIGDRS